MGELLGPVLGLTVAEGMAAHWHAALPSLWGPGNWGLEVHYEVQPGPGGWAHRLEGINYGRGHGWGVLQGKPLGW